MTLKDIVLTANSNLFKSKLRTFLTASAIFIGALTFMLTSGAGYGLKAYLNQQLSSVGAKNDLFITAHQNNGSGVTSSTPKEYNPNKTQATANRFVSLTKADIQKISHAKGIQNVTPIYPVSPEYVTSGGKKFLTSLTQGIPGLKQPLLAGKLVDNNAQNHQVTLPPEYVNSLGYSSNKDAIGKTITLAFKDASGRTFVEQATIVGVQEKTIINGNAMTANVPFVKQIYSKMTVGLPTYAKDKYEAAAAVFDSSLTNNQLNDLKNTLSREGYSAKTVKDQLGIIENVVNGIITFLDAFAVIALLAASFGIVNTLLMAVQERTREIGLMKALGMGRGKIFLLFATEAVMIGFWGSVIALGAAHILGHIGNTIASKTILKDFQGLHPLAFPWVPMILIIVAIMFVAFLAATLPARRASKLDPIEALRYE